MPGILDLMAHGLAAVDTQLAQDVALAVARISVGVFFAISGGNKLFVASRHASLRANLTKNGIPAVPFMEWWVPFWEFVSGAMLAVGLLSAFSAGVLAIICVVAICCESSRRVEAFKPINRADRVADYLYLQEVLYLVLLVVTMIAGTGRYSLDHVLFSPEPPARVVSVTKTACIAVPTTVRAVTAL